VARGFRKTAERSIHRGRIIELVSAEFESPDGDPFEREIVRHPGAVSVVPLHDDGTVVLVRQYRAALDQLLLEIPAGLRDVDDEQPETTANRELVEEVGLRAGRLERLAVFHNSAGFSDERSIVFLGTQLSEAVLDRQGLEEQHMTIERIALDDVPGMIDRAEITDAKTIIGLSLTLGRLRPGT
jgi:8-oxo-dGTP pyrophosphatase MutT (NUDIX family)